MKNNVEGLIVVVLDDDYDEDRLEKIKELIMCIKDVVGVEEYKENTSLLLARKKEKIRIKKKLNEILE